MNHKFVEFIPDNLEEGVIYVSLQYTTAIHKCVCGCGNEVVTPLSPNDWQLTFNGESISLSPSIGNWNFKCQSHYWIVNNKVIKAREKVKFKSTSKNKKSKNIIDKIDKLFKKG